MSSFETVRANLDTELAALAPASVKSVLFGRRFDFAGYPSLRYYLVAITNELLAAGGGIPGASQYRRGYVFQIDIVQEASQKDQAQAELDLGKAVDAVCSKLEQKWNLAGANDLLTAPTSAGSAQQTGAAGKEVVISLVVTSRVITSY